MSFDGHEIVKLSDTWVLDLSTFTGYNIELNNSGRVTKFRRAFKVEDKDHNKKFKYTYYVDKVSIGVLRKTERTIIKYYKEALVDG